MALDAETLHAPDLLDGEVTTLRITRPCALGACVPCWRLVFPVLLAVPAGVPIGMRRDRLDGVCVATAVPETTLQRIGDDGGGVIRAIGAIRAKLESSLAI